METFYAIACAVAIFTCGFLLGHTYQATPKKPVTARFNALKPIESVKNIVAEKKENAAETEARFYQEKALRNFFDFDGTPQKPLKKVGEK